MFDYQQTVTRAQSGDNTARQALYDQTIKGVYYIVSRLVERQEDVEDLVQDTYVSAFTQLDRLSDPQAFVKWLHRIATNTAANHLKKKRPVLFATDEQEEQVLGSIPAVGEDFIPEEFALNQELRTTLMDAIGQLPEKQRMAIFLHYYEGTPVKELAEALNVGENTVKSRLNAGRAGIRKHLEKLGITGVTMTVLALALRNDAAAASVPEAAHAAIWAGVKGTLASAAGTVAAGTAAGSAATAAGATAAAGTATTAVKAGIFSTLWAKVTAAVLAAAVVVGAGVGISLNSRSDHPRPPAGAPFQSVYGIPEEMGFCEYCMDDKEVPDLLPLLTHDFGQPLASYEFDNGTLTVHYYADGYGKAYIKRGAIANYDQMAKKNHAIFLKDALGNEFCALNLFECMICSADEQGTADMIGSTNITETGDYVFYLSNMWNYHIGEPVEAVCLEFDSDDIVFTMTLTASTGSLPQPTPDEPVAQPLPEPEQPVDEPEAPDQEPEQPVQEPEKPAPSTAVTLDTSLLDLTDVTFDEVTDLYGSSTYNTEMGYYYFKNANIGLAYAYGKDTGCNYVACTLGKILTNCPSSMTASQLKQYLVGGREAYDEMDGRNIFFWEYKGCTAYIYPNSSGRYGADSLFNYNCADRVDQTPTQPEPSTTVSALELLGKTKSEIEAITGQSLYYEGQFGALMLTGVDGSRMFIVYTDGTAGSGKCIGLGVTLADIIPDCPSSMTADQLKSRFGDYYKDSWAGSNRFCTVYNGYNLIFLPSGEDSGRYTPDSHVSVAPASTTVFGEFGTYWHNYSSAEQAHMEIISRSSTAMTCKIDMAQRYGSMRVAETGSFSLTSTDGITYTAANVEDNWGSINDITVTFDKGAARITINCTQRDQMANYGFSDSLILYRGG